MRIGHIGTTIARFAGAALAGVALLASIGCTPFDPAALSFCTLQDASARVDGTVRSYRLQMECEGPRFGNDRADVQAGYDAASKQAKERISHPEGKVTSTWTCTDDPWIVANARCQRGETSISSPRYATSLQQTIDNLPQDRPYSAQKLNAGDRNRLQGLLADALRPKPAPPAAPAPAQPGPIHFPAVIWPLVEQGATGEAVTSIQYLLRGHGLDVAVDGEFGPQTVDAVRTFQRRVGLEPSGTVGRATWFKLAVELREGDQGEAVRAAQSQLASRGMDVAIDGDFGPQTGDAVRRYQRAKGLTVDGVVTLTTWAALVGGK